MLRRKLLQQLCAARFTAIVYQQNGQVIAEQARDDAGMQCSVVALRTGQQPARNESLAVISRTFSGGIKT